jgi:hypothetical protein
MCHSFVNLPCLCIIALFIMHQWQLKNKMEKLCNAMKERKVFGNFNLVVIKSNEKESIVADC